MKEGLTIDALADRAYQIAASARDYVVDTRQVYAAVAVRDIGEVTGDAQNYMLDASLPEGASQLRLYAADLGELPEFDGGLPIRQVAHSQIGERLQIPKKFYDRLREGHPDLLAHNLTQLFRREPERRMLRLIDSEVRAFLSDRYRRIDHWDVLSAVYPILRDMPDVEFPSCEITETRMYVRALLPRIQAEVNVGDIVQAGVQISNSEVGWGALSVQPIVYRLVCKNGMIAADFGTKRYHVGARIGDTEESYRIYRTETMQADDEALMLKLADTVRAVCDETVFGTIVARCKELAEIRVEQPIEAVERLSQRLVLTEEEQDAVLRNLVDGGELTGWGLLNAVTRTAQDADSFDRAVELERFGGQLAEEPEVVHALVRR
jgi:Domain of unknown function (DUF932)